MKKKIKKFIIPGTALLASLYFSFIFAIGGIIAYLSTELFCKKFIMTNKVKLLTFNFQKWEIHFHHWLIASLILFAVYFLKSFSLSTFWLGILGGLIFHDIYTNKKWRTDDKKWYQVVYKNPSRF